jgi:hypothetical protein
LTIHYSHTGEADVRLHRDGRSLRLIQELIGVSSLSAVKNLIEGDPVCLSAIVRGVI